MVDTGLDEHNAADVLQILVKARATLGRPWGWFKGMYAGRQRGVDCYCALGALRLAAGVPVSGVPLWDLPETPLYLSAVGVVEGVAGSDLARRNDNPDTTKTDVLGWFDTAIARVKEYISG